MLRAINTRKRSFVCLEEEVHPVAAFDNSTPKSGKWSTEEEYFANKLIAEFEAGTATDCSEGCTLRSYLAKHLNCAPMRISKKFAGQCIGKHTFTRRERADTATTDVESCSLSTASVVASEQDELEHSSVEHKLHTTMSFDTFTEFERYHAEVAPVANPQPYQWHAPVGAPAAAPDSRPLVPTENFWCTYATLHPQRHILPHLKRHLQDAYVCAAQATPCADPAVGLDLDQYCEQYAAAGQPSCPQRRLAAEVTPDPPLPVSYLAKAENPQEIAFARMPECVPRPAYGRGAAGGTALAHAPAPTRYTPTATLRSGAAVFAPVPASLGGWGQAADSCSDTGGSDSTVNEAEEWREVLTYFCAQAHRGRSLPAWQGESAALGTKSASYSSLIL